jgi:hypothetical protein
MGVLFESIVGTLLALAEQTTPKKTTQMRPPLEASQTSKPQRAEVKMEARVAPFWQQVMTDRMESGGFDQAWGVFSYGGWSDAGQMILLHTKKNPEKALLIVGKPNRQEIDFERIIDPQQLKPLILKLDGIKKLEDVDLPMFDGLVFEMAYAERVPENAVQKPTIVKRVYYKNPGTKQKFPGHDEILDVAEKLKTKP